MRGHRKGAGAGPYKGGARCGAIGRGAGAGPYKGGARCGAIGRGAGAGS